MNRWQRYINKSEVECFWRKKFIFLYFSKENFACASAPLLTSSKYIYICMYIWFLLLFFECIIINFYKLKLSYCRLNCVWPRGIPKYKKAYATKSELLSNGSLGRRTSFSDRVSDSSNSMPSDYQLNIPGYQRTNPESLIYHSA